MSEARFCGDPILKYSNNDLVGSTVQCAHVGRARGLEKLKNAMGVHISAIKGGKRDLAREKTESQKEPAAHRQLLSPSLSRGNIGTTLRSTSGARTSEQEKATATWFTLPPCVSCPSRSLRYIH